jgi:hypothetical protein
LLWSRVEEDSEPGNYPNMYRKLGASVGAAFDSNFDTSVEVGADTAVGATLDLEALLGLDEKNFLVRVDSHYSFSPRHRVDVSVYDIGRGGPRTIAGDIQVGQAVIPAGEVNTSLDTRIVKAAYRYNFVVDERTAIGTSFGLHTMGIDFQVASSEFEVSERFRVTAPLPVIGLHGEYALSKRWKLRGSAELFQIDLGFGRASWPTTASRSSTTCSITSGGAWRSTVSSSTLHSGTAP